MPLHRSDILNVVMLFILGGLCSSTILVAFHNENNRAGTETGASARVATLSPPVTEMLFALNQQDRIAGVGSYCTYPEAALDLPQIGGYLSPNFERMHVLSPDIVFVQGRNPKMTSFCRRRGIRCISLKLDSLSEILRSIRIIGSELQCPAATAELLRGMNSQLDQIRDRASIHKPVRVFVCVNRIPGEMGLLTTVNSSEFLGEIVTLAGGFNVFGSQPKNYPQVSAEAIVKAAPEAIIELCPSENMSFETKRRRLADWQRLSSIPAVHNGRIYIISDDYTLVPGPRVTATARRVVELLHPQAEAY